MIIFNYLRKVFIKVDDSFIEKLKTYPLIRFNNGWYLEGVAYFTKILGIDIVDIESSLEGEDTYLYIYFDKFISIDKLIEITSNGSIGVTSYFDNVNDVNRELLCYKIKI